MLLLRTGRLKVVLLAQNKLLHSSASILIGKPNICSVYFVGTDFQSKRYIRKKVHDHFKTESKEKSEEDTSNTKEKDPKEEFKKEYDQKFNQATDELKQNLEKLAPEEIRRMRLVIFLSSMVFTFGLFYLLIPVPRPTSELPAGVEHIPFDVFIGKVLPSGEVKNIVYMPRHQKAIAYLYSGALLDGKPLHQDALIIEYSRGHGSPMNFLTELRDAEQKLGVPLTQGLEVTVTWERSPTMRLVMLMLGLGMLAMVILNFRMANRIMKDVAEKKSKKPPPS